MDQTADLQAQVLALRNAVESLWLSMMYADPDRDAHAKRLHESSLAAVRALNPVDADGAAMRQAVMEHTDKLWRSIAAQLAAAPKAPSR